MPQRRRRLSSGGAADEFQVTFPPGTTMASVSATICAGITTALGGGTNCQVGTITANGTFVPNPTATDSDDFFDDPLMIAAIGGSSIIGGRWLICGLQMAYDAYGDRWERPMMSRTFYPFFYITV